MRCLKLPFQFDPERLRSDLALVRPEEWIPHINRRHYEGEWSGAPLRAIGGAMNNIIPDAIGASRFADTPLLSRCRNFQDVLATFKCPLQSVRLLRLHAGSSIAEHVDQALDFDDGEVRIHVPIVTNDDVRFYLDGARLIMAPGECWYTNVNLPHSVENNSGIDRVHLVIDCGVDTWLQEIFQSTPESATDIYSADLSLATVPAAHSVLELVSQYAGAAPEAPRFRVERDTLVLQWPERHAWQIRVRTAAVTTGWHARLETSPDPDRRHGGRVERLLQSFHRAFPAITIHHKGLA